VTEVTFDGQILLITTLHYGTIISTLQVLKKNNDYKDVDKNEK